MIPRHTLWGWFTREGRIKNRWALALNDTDEARGLGRMRKVRRELAADPGRTSHLWLPFLESFLDSRRVRSLADKDLREVEGMGERAP